MLDTKLSKEQLTIKLGLDERGFYNKDGSINEAAVIKVLAEAVENAMELKADIENQAINKAKSQKKRRRRTAPDRSWLYTPSNVMEEDE